LRVGYKPDEGCWILPERDDSGRVVGLLRRYANGGKFAMDGSRRGLTIPHYGKHPPRGPIYLAEGATDAAALHAVGVFAYGRFSAAGSALERLWLERLLRRHADRAIIVVGDNDSGAGVLGAQKLAEHLSVVLARLVRCALPRKGFKDIREQVVAGKWSRGLRVMEQRS
jgi:phage/plasmid primase-like uncharacterized protein